ncbi:homoserine kinase [Chlamydia abortus]|uniref:Phosphotransferase enzyme family protein n=1 Tax=Paenibacillus residui TaxID=629724 RepID=A0ABW3D9N2_9BACL|nr:homoserine kinase [Chlamydia abortus]
MNDVVWYDTEENRRSLLAKARKVALTALLQYDLEWDRIQFIQLSDTITYKIKTSTEQIYLLRIHSNRLGKEEIRSELTLLEALNKAADLNVPEGLACRDGSYVLEISAEEGVQPLHVTMTRWVEGEHVNGELTDDLVYSMGVMMGRLHETAAGFVPPPDFVRPQWGADSFRREMAKLERYNSCFLSAEAWKSYQAAFEKIVTELAEMHRNDHNYGLIHADLHSGNIVFNEGRPHPIDFGSCGYGYYLYDMAGALLELHPRQRRTFIQGYESIRKLETDYVRHLQCFFIMFMIENYCHHAPDPGETSNLLDEQPYAQAYIREYLNDVPFLFRVIEPVKIVWSE